MKAKGNGAEIKSSLSWFDEAEASQGLDPAGGVTLNRKCFIVGGAIPVIFAPLEHEEDGAQHFVTQGHDGAFVPASHEERLKLRFEGRSSAAGGMSELTQKATDIGVAFTCPPGFALTS